MSHNVSLNQFIGEIGTRGVAKHSHFFVMVMVPDAIQFNKSGVSIANSRQRSLMMRIEQVNMPGRNMLSFSQRYGNGPIREIPYGVSFQNVTMSVILSEDMFERQLFLQWQDLFLGGARTRSSKDTPAGVWDLGYYDECVGQVEIFQFAESPSMQGVKNSKRGFLGNAKDVAQTIGFDTSIIERPYGFSIFGDKPRPIEHATKVTLVEAYPRSVNDVPMDWNNDGIARLNVDFQYRFFTDEHMSPEHDRFSGMMNQKSDFRRTVEAFQKFTPVYSAIRNMGTKGYMKSRIESSGGAVRNTIGTNRRVLPF